MNFVTGLLIYVSLFVVLLFMILPIGVERSVRSERGCDPGAPSSPHIGLKLLSVTALSLVILGIIYGIMRAYDLA